MRNMKIRNCPFFSDFDYKIGIQEAILCKIMSIVYSHNQFISS